MSNNQSQATRIPLNCQTVSEQSVKLLYCVKNNLPLLDYRELDKQNDSPLGWAEISY